MHRGLFALLSIIALGCSDAERRAPQAANSAPAFLEARFDTTKPDRPIGQDSLLEQLEQLILRLGHSRAAIASSLGSPQSVSTKAGEGPDGGVDTLITIDYPGLQIILRKSSNDRQEYFSNVRAVGPAFRLPRGLRLRTSTREDVTRLVGLPPNTYVFGDTTVFSYETGSGLVIQFYLLRDILNRIRWVYELG